MRKIFLHVLLVLLISSFSVNSAFAGGKDYIQEKINGVMEDSSLYGSTAGVCVKNLKTGEVIYEYNSTYPLAPASNMKILTTSSSLVLLGVDFCFDTGLYGKDIQDGNLMSDLILFSNGDPSYCLNFYDPPTKVLDFMAKKLYSQGIRNIKGDLIADDSFFDRKLTGKGWKPSYQFESYSAQISPLSLNENVVDIRVYPGEGYELPGIVTIFPPAGVIQVNNQTKTSDYDETISISRQEGTNVITVSGWVPADYTYLESYITVHEPSLYTASAFAGILKSNGINLEGKVRLIDLSTERNKKEDYNLLCSHKSPPLPEIIAYVNKYSDNLTAEILLKTIGGVVYDLGTSENGGRAIKDFLGQIKADTSGLIIADGSGLSPENRVTSRLISDIFYYMYNSPLKDNFLNSLSVAGKDGTLRKRFRGTTAEGNCKAKTGTISGVSALSGYVSTSYGETVCFSLLFNNDCAGKDVEDRIVQAISNCPDKI